jgi:hypothetical protein
LPILWEWYCDDRSVLRNTLMLGKLITPLLTHFRNCFLSNSHPGRTYWAQNQHLQTMF